MTTIQDTVGGDQPSLAALTTSSSVHPAIAVLTNPTLRDLVVDFQTGIPFAVTKHVTPSNIEALTSRGFKYRVGYNFAKRGVLAHVAIVAGDIDALKRVYKLAQQPHYHDDLRLDLSIVMRCAVLFNRMDVLEWIRELKAQGCEWDWEPNLMGVAMEYADGTELQVVEWIDAHAPRAATSHRTFFMYKCVAAGRLDLVQWLRARGDTKITRRLVACATYMGRADVLAYLYQRTWYRAKQRAVNIAAERGHLDTLKVVIAHQRRETTLRAINYAAKCGKVDVVQFLLDSDLRHDALQVIDFAACSSDLEVVQFFHSRFPRACTHRALENAAMTNCVEVVKFLLEHRSEGSPARAFVIAIQRGAVEVVKFFHEHYPHLECPPLAVTQAAGYGHLAVVAFLFHARPETRTSDMLYLAARRGHLSVVTFLCENGCEGSTDVALKRAAFGGELDAVKYLHARLQPRESAFAALASAAFKITGPGCGREHYAIFQYLLDHERADEPEGLLEHAARTNRAVVSAAKTIWTQVRARMQPPM